MDNSDKAELVPLAPPNSPKAEDGVSPAVWFVQGRKANKAFRSALALHREDATLSEVQGTHDEKADTQHDVPKEEGHDAVQTEHR